MAFCLLDAARIGDAMDQAKSLEDTHHLCLYKGSAEEKFSHVAPYLFSTQHSAIAEWLFTEGWGQSWGVFIIAETNLDQLHRHFRRFLRIKTETDQQLYFRFYDPRVLRLFLPTCNQAQLLDFFGPIRYFLVEDSDPAYGINFWLERGQLRQQRIEKARAETSYLNYLENL